MPHLFNNRRIAESYHNLGVIIHSEGFRNRLGHICFTLKFQFGKYGTWGNELKLYPNGTNLLEISKEYHRYQDDLLEQINVLEELDRWVRHAKDGDDFQYVLCQEKPMLFYGQVRGDRISIKIFGEGLCDLVIFWDPTARRMKNSVGEEVVLSKLAELREALRDHLNVLDKVPASMMQGEPA